MSFFSNPSIRYLILEYFKHLTPEKICKILLVPFKLFPPRFMSRASILVFLRDFNRNLIYFIAD